MNPAGWEGANLKDRLPFSRGGGHVAWMQVWEVQEHLGGLAPRVRGGAERAKQGLCSVAPAHGGFGAKLESSVTDRWGWRHVVRSCSCVSHLSGVRSLGFVSTLPFSRPHIQPSIFPFLRTLLELLPLSSATLLVVPVPSSARHSSAVPQVPDSSLGLLIGPLVHPALAPGGWFQEAGLATAFPCSKPLSAPMTSQAKPWLLCVADEALQGPSSHARHASAFSHMLHCGHTGLDVPHTCSLLCLYLGFVLCLERSSFCAPPFSTL